VKDKAGELRYAGTAFFVLLPSEVVPDYGLGYLVTAKHTIAGIQAAGFDAVYLRLNTAHGFELIETKPDDWVFHEKPSADVAVLPMKVPEGFDHLGFLLTGAATNEVITKHKIGIGDEVFVVGLFASHHGRQRNIPIVRVGTIAAMPEEPLDTKMGEMDAYLLEIRSIGGLSGSPAFVYLDPFRHVDAGKFWLLGLIHGHWGLKASKQATVLEEDLEKEKINMGIAIVPPVSIVLEVLNMGELAEERERLEKRVRE
jgi:hypothetical protein